MATKLTLSADPELVKEAKALAARRGMSVSAMFAHFVRAARGKFEKNGDLPPLTRKASGLIGASARKIPVGRLTRKVSGIIRVPKDKSYRELLEDALAEKYGL